MGFWRRLTEFLFVTGGYNDQFRFTSDHTEAIAIDSIIDIFDPVTIIGGSCNTPANRTCWTPDLNITTDYEEVVPEGVTRKVRALAHFLI
jgi:hypothetical protein